MEALPEPAEEVDLRLVQESPAEREELYIRLEANRRCVAGEIGEVKRSDLAVLDSANPGARRGDEASDVALPHSGGDPRDAKFAGNVGEDPPGVAGCLVQRPRSIGHSMNGAMWVITADLPANYRPAELSAKPRG
jgi:hypothetical protein